MKKSISLLSLIALVCMANVASAMDIATVKQVSIQNIAQQVARRVALDLIKWKVGDQENYQVSLGSFGKIGTMVNSVTQDTGTAIWTKEEFSAMGQNEVVETLINKADGKILKMIRNGQEQAVPDDKPEIISQDYGDVTVPAGTFKAIHVVAKTKDVPKLEIWANPQAVCMDGTLKAVIDSQMGPVVLELTSFKKAP